MHTHERDPSFLRRLDDFVEAFRDAFRRRDQARWASVYVQGLLLPGSDRKTIGTMARRVVLPADLVVEDVAQALQNFVNQSPWDDRSIGRRLRDRLADSFADRDGAFVIDELAIPKQGRHSPGVQRQYSSALGRKTNCQVAVVLYHHGPGGACPLALRLYLPKNWVGDTALLDSAGVPQEYRVSMSKAAIALELLDEVRAERWPARIAVAGNGYAADPDFRAALRDRGFTYVADADPDRPASAEEHLDLFGDGTAIVASRPVDETLRNAWRGKAAARQTGRSLLQDFGLEHFEGRSWRGFHHHACLVLVAFAFRALSGAGLPYSQAT